MHTGAPSHATAWCALAAVFKRPRTAFNFFTNAHIDEARADKEAALPGGPMLRVAGAPLEERGGSGGGAQQLGHAWEAGIAHVSSQSR